MHPVIEYLKSPELVVQVQEFFGIEYLREDKSKNDCTKQRVDNGSLQNRKNQLSSSARKRFIDEDATQCGGSDSNDSSDKKSDDSKNDKPYRVTNKFWYYLFIIGTELGDEIFYATFIPFWFWNIDSAVGRRVIMVWSAVMYVGMDCTLIYQI